MGMEATFTITERDYVRAMVLFSKIKRKAASIYLAIVVALALAALILPFPFWLFAIGPLVGGIVGGVLFHFGLTQFMAKRHYRKYKAIQEPIAIQLKDEGVWFESADYSGVVKWEKIYRWRQNNNYLLIYPMPRLFHIIPKTVADSGFDLSSLIETLQTKVGKPI